MTSLTALSWSTFLATSTCSFSLRASFRSRSAARRSLRSSSFLEVRFGGHTDTLLFQTVDLGLQSRDDVRRQKPTVVEAASEHSARGTTYLFSADWYASPLPPTALRRLSLSLTS